MHVLSAVCQMLLRELESRAASCGWSNREDLSDSTSPDAAEGKRGHRHTFSHLVLGGKLGWGSQLCSHLQLGSCGTPSSRHRCQSQSVEHLEHACKRGSKTCNETPQGSNMADTARHSESPFDRANCCSSLTFWYAQVQRIAEIEPFSTPPWHSTPPQVGVPLPHQAR